MTLRSSHNRTLKILKSAGIGGCLFVVAALFAFWPWPTEREDSSEEANLHSMHFCSWRFHGFVSPDYGRRIDVQPSGYVFQQTGHAPGKRHAFLAVG